MSKKFNLLENAKASRRVCEAGSMTVSDFAVESGVSRAYAQVRLNELVASGKARKTWKQVNGRTVPAYIEV